MNNVDAVKSLYKKHHIETGLTIRGDCEKDLSGVLLENGDSLAFTFDDVLAEKTKLQADYNAKKYQRDRVPEYPSIQEQLDMQYWDAVNGTKKWQEAVAKVKTDNPKPE